MGGIITDVYLGISSPQGAIRAGADEFEIGTGAAESLLPPGVEDSSMLADYAPVARDRLCPGTADVFTAYTLAARADARPQQYFDDRRVADRFSEVTAAVLVGQGLQDNDFHAFQEDTIWSKLPNAPKWFVLGQWGHTLRISDQLASFTHAESWLDLQLAWYDFWLKGLGDPPRMGVDYQDTSMIWHNATAWPPEGRVEVLYLAGETLGGSASSDERSFSALPQETANDYCPSISPLTPSLVYVSPAATNPITVAGNVFAYLQISSDQPGGTFSAELIRLPKGYTCAGGNPEIASSGGIDLRFHQGNFGAVPFPVGTSTPVRLDFHNLALRLEAGDQLGVVLRNPRDRDTREFAPTITVHGASHVVLPLVAGTLGGAQPLTDYPARPFA